MRIQNPKRSILIGVIVWLLFFGWWFRGYLFRNWRFRLFSFKSWHYLIHEFRAGWQISSKSDWIFIASFIAAPFIFGFLWYLAEKIHWRKIWKKIWGILKWPFLIGKKKKLKEVESTYSPKQPAQPFVYRPQAMPSSGSRVQSLADADESQRTFLNNTTAMGDFPESAPEPDDFVGRYRQEPSEPKVKPFTNEAFAEMADTPLSEIEIPQMEPAEEDIPALLERAGYVELSVDDADVDFVAASASEVLIALYDTTEGDWLADEESFNDEDPLWFSETDHRISPVFQLKTEAENWQQKLGDEFVVRPVLIEQKGNIINAEDMMKTWNDLGVTVCRTDVGGPVELPTMTEVLREKQEKISEEALEKIKNLL